MEIRPITEAEWPLVWAVIREVVTARETFPYDPAMTEEQARNVWIKEPPGRTVVAVEGDRVLGTAQMGPNRPGPGSHVSTASFMVAGHARKRGLGTALCTDALEWARQQGYAGMQFNAVVETNAAAVQVYERLGFQILGTVPRAYLHRTEGLVGLHLMYREF